MKGTIKSKEDIERLFQKGRRSSSSFMTILSLPVDNKRRGRCAFIAGKKMGNAPLRSRCKRVMRELARELGAPWNGYDVAFVARRTIAFKDHEKLVESTRDQLEKIGILK